VTASKNGAMIMTVELENKMKEIRNSLLQPIMAQGTMEPHDSPDIVKKAFSENA
jgi:hypothetical protein